MCLHYIHPDPTPVLVPRTPTCPPASLGQPSPSSESMLFAQQRVCGPAPWALQSGVLHGTVWVAAGRARQSHWQDGERIHCQTGHTHCSPGNICVMGRVCHD